MEIIYLECQCLIVQEDVHPIRGVMYEADIDKTRLALQQGRCPDCGGHKFLKGPSGGLCDNIECAQCGADFNVGPITGERIGWNRSGCWRLQTQLRGLED